MGKTAKAVCIMGPTASGKSALAVDLARQAPFEIVSVDSVQVYSGLDIGSAKPDSELMAEIPHHLIDVRDPGHPYSASDFRKDAIELVREIVGRGRIPLLSGGTMLYFKALKQGLADLPSADETIRQKFADFAAESGWPALHERLAVVDPVSAARINPNDPQRLQRALEVYEITGKSMTELQVQATRPCPFKLLEIAVIPPDRAELHQTIEKRFRHMLTRGLVEEVEQLYVRDDLNPSLPAIKAVGYRQVWDYLAGNTDYDTMVERAITATRQFAKRQFTWLRSWQDLRQIDSPKRSEALKILQADSILG